MSEEKLAVQIETPKPAVQPVAPPIDQEDEVVVDTEGLDEQEIKMGQDSGVLKKPVESTEEGEVKPAPKPVEKQEEKVEDPKSFEEMDKAYNDDQKRFEKNFTYNAKALYFKAKRDKMLRQEAEKKLVDSVASERLALKKTTERYDKLLADIQNVIDRIDEGDESLTTADIRKVILLRDQVKEKVDELRGEGDETDNGKPSDSDQRYLQEKTKNALILGQSKYENFEHYINLANEVVAEDKDIAGIITKAFHDKDVDEEQLVEKIVKYARMHPDFARKSEVKGKENQQIDRIVANSQKKKTSASLTTGSGPREKSDDDLIPEDVIGMSQKRWNSLPDKVRERLMRESSKSV